MAKYQTINMLRAAGLEQDRLEGNVPYLTPAKRAPYEVTVILLDTVTPGSKSGRLFQGRKPVMQRMDTSDGTNPVGKYLFVMDGDGRVYAAPARAVVHHSAFLAGGPVAAAGLLEVDHGRLTGADNDSGHYKPPIEFLDQFLREMGSRGVDLAGVTPRHVAGSGTLAKQKELAQQPRFKAALERI